MKLGLRIKIVGIVGFALAIMVFFWSYKDLKTLKTQYLQTVQAHAEVMAQFLIFLQNAADLKPVHFRHDEIEQDNIGLDFFGFVDAFQAVGRGGDFEAFRR